MNIIEIVAIVVGSVVAFAIIAILRHRERKRRHELVQSHFGPEYDATADAQGNAVAADKELARRLTRVERFELHPLTAEERTRFRHEWDEVQRRFLDDPAVATREAHALVQRLMTTRGYPEVDVAQRVDDLSVHHPNLVPHFREATDVVRRARSGDVSTEALRQATVNHRAMFDDLMDAPSSGERALTSPRSRSAASG